MSMKAINLNYIQDETIRNRWEMILDQAYRAVEKYQSMNTSFLTPAEWIYAEDILSGVPDLYWLLDGGYENSERKTITMKHNDLSEFPSEQIIDVLSIKSTSKFQTLTHRDYLGAILSLGIKREKIGDLLVMEGYAIVFTFAEMAEYISQNLSRIANCSVKVREMSEDEVNSVEPEYKIVKGTVASMRVDSLVALAYALSRKEAQALISQEKVRVNWKTVYKSNVELKENELISVSGYGRAVLLEVGGTTRSDRRHVTIGHRR